MTFGIRIDGGKDIFFENGNVSGADVAFDISNVENFLVRRTVTDGPVGYKVRDTTSFQADGNAHSDVRGAARMLRPPEPGAPIPRWALELQRRLEVKWGVAGIKPTRGDAANDDKV